MLPKGLLKEYSRTISFCMRLCDMVVIFMSGWFAYWVRFQDDSLPTAYWTCLCIAFLATPIVFSSAGVYQSARAEGFLKHSVKLIEAITMLALLLTGLAALTQTGVLFSRIWFFYWVGFALVGTILYRGSVFLALRFMRSHGLNERRVVIFGAGELGSRFAETVQQALWTGFSICAFIDDHSEEKPTTILGVPVVQTPAHLSQYLKEHSIDEVWLALPLRADERVKSILYELRHQTITTRFVLDIFGLDLLNHSVADIAGFPVINIRSTPMIGANRLIKALEDRMLAFIILVLISPLLVVIALGVKLSSPGPVFFKQRRLGWDGRVIKVYKFRTMYLHKEENNQVTQATAKDPRITPFGRFLRRTSLDELPQFINVLQGRMSIVGPRPHALQHNELYKDSVPTYMQRHHVKPGITGWAQINGWRGETDTLEKMKKRVEYDLYYINNWSLVFDLKIIALTIVHGFVDKNAY